MKKFAEIQVIIDGQNNTVKVLVNDESVRAYTFNEETRNWAIESARAYGYVLSCKYRKCTTGEIQF